jgi:hypothetical protein
MRDAHAHTGSHLVHVALGAGHQPARAVSATQRGGSRSSADQATNSSTSVPSAPSCAPIAQWAGGRRPSAARHTLTSPPGSPSNSTSTLVTAASAARRTAVCAREAREQTSPSLATVGRGFRPRGGTAWPARVRTAWHTCAARPRPSGMTLRSGRWWPAGQTAHALSAQSTRSAGAASPE